LKRKSTRWERRSRKRMKIGKTIQISLKQLPTYLTIPEGTKGPTTISMMIQTQYLIHYI
jgi:hypothetical protein